MKASAAAINGALAVGGLIAAYVTWQHPKDITANENVIVLEASKGTLGKVRYEDGTRALEVFRTDGEKTVWLSQELLPGSTVKLATPSSPEDGGSRGGKPVELLGPDAGAVATLTANPAERSLLKRVRRGNDRAETLLARFTPFEAVRALGKLPAEKQKELGLEASGERKLTITVSGQTHLYLVSNPQVGMVGTYLRDEKDQSIYLLAGSLLADLEPSSQALIDRRLHAFRAPEFDEFVLSGEGGKHAYLQKDAEIPQTMKVTAKETPEKPDDLVRNWHDKVWNRLIVTEVLGKGEAPKGGEPKVELRIDYLSRGSGKGFLELAKTTTGDLWARSENTAGWVGLHTGTDDLVAEAKKFTGGK